MPQPVQCCKLLKAFPRCRNVVDIEHNAAAAGFREFSLRAMCSLLLGKALSKKQQMSNWERQSLTQAQVAYAACDAWASREAALYLLHPTGYTELGLPEFDAEAMQAAWLQRQQDRAAQAKQPMPGATAQGQQGKQGQKRQPRTSVPAGQRKQKRQRHNASPRLPGTGRLPLLERTVGGSQTSV